jgi:CRISPR-associated protein Csm3
MYGKLKISGKLIVKTGMHIGSSSAFSAIGAVDKSVVRDTATNEPMIPGSSLKGKMRTLLAKARGKSYQIPRCENDAPEVKRLFGSPGSNKDNENPKLARLHFIDAFLLNGAQLKKQNGLTEVKFENAINRITAVANPRQIERVVKGSEFGVSFIYDMEEEKEIDQDIATIIEAMKLLSLDYLGGHGTRGYGNVAFTNLQAEVVFGDVKVDIDKINQMLQEVETYGSLAL